MRLVLAYAVTAFALVYVARTATSIVRILRTGQPAVGRTDALASRTKVMLVETLGHTRMLKWSVQGAAHWFVFIGFGALFGTLAQAYGELIDPEFAPAADRRTGRSTWPSPS